MKITININLSFLGSKMSLENLSYICSRYASRVWRVRRDARVVDWGGLENRCPGNWTEGSNPSLSATDNTGRTAARQYGYVFMTSPKEPVPEGKE